MPRRAQKLSWGLSGNVGQIPLPGRDGQARASLTNWDFVIGFRGRFAFGQDNAWFIPYHLDMGSGDSDFTWQAMAGVGYAFRWGEAVGFWRHLGYDLDTDPADRAGVQEMDFSGPGLGVVFRW